jgi:hypothetical protein
VTVDGTGFLHAPGVTGAKLDALLGAADVSVKLSPQDLGHVLHDGDPALEALVHEMGERMSETTRLTLHELFVAAEKRRELADVAPAEPTQQSVSA